MDNNFDSMLDMYLFEENTLLEQLDEIMLKAESDQSFDEDCINEIFRIMHTIKGSSAMMQFNGIMAIAHKIEDLFYYIRENGIDNKYNEDLVSLVFKSTDFIKGEIAKIEDGQPLEEDITSFEVEIKKMLDMISGSGDKGSEDEAALTKEDAKTETKSQSQNKYAIKVFFDDESGMENLRAFFIVNALNEAGVEFSYVPENVENDGETAKQIIKDGFFLYFKDDEALQTGIGAVKSALNVKNYTVMELDGEPEDKKVDDSKKPAADEKQAKKSPDKAPKGKTKELGKHNKQSLITVNLSKLDSLLDIVGEIVIAESMVYSNNEIKKLNLESFTKSTRHLRKLTDELQDIVMSLRMVPVSGIFQKMRRIVRDMGKDLKKDVDLILIGEETEVDKTIVDGISDPIMHLVRNAMDHGLETPEERVSKNKDSKGTIKLSAANTGGEILIKVEDDGRGFEVEKVLEKAKSKGLLTKPESEYTSKEIYQLIMMPGFSTNDKVTEYSGRGVGMDVVKANVEKVGGTVILDSKKDKGSVITFKIPLTLAIVSGMQVIVGDSELIIPIKNIQQSFKANMSDVVKNTDGEEIIVLRDKCYPIVRLHQYFGFETEVAQIEDGILILVEAGENSICLFVDSIIGEQQVVVKPLPTIYNKYGVKELGISGCSILGDGSINLILDVAGIIENM